jgi:hypothetical protein
LLREPTLLARKHHHGTSNSQRLPQRHQDGAPFIHQQRSQMTQPIQLWDTFRDVFVAALEESKTEDFQNAWRSATNRTHFYKNKLFSRIASQLGLKQRDELFKVDIALCKQSEHGHDVPIAFIESENSAKSASHEMWKLCSLASPLKILITCTEWGDHWQNNKRTTLLSEWKKRIQSHNEIWPHSCVFGIIVGELHGGVIRFYACAYREDGSEIGSHEQIFLRQLI